MNSTLSNSPETLKLGQDLWFLSHGTLKFDRWPRNTIEHLFYAPASFLHPFVAEGGFQLELQSGNAQIVWSYSPEMPKLEQFCFDLYGLCPWPLTLIFCMDITFV